MKRNYLPSIVTVAWTLWLVVLIFLLASCAAQQYQNVDTTRKAIVVATAEVRAANLLLQDLIQRHAITPSQANRALASLQDAKNQLQTALNAVNVAGDPLTAQNALERADVLLSFAINLIAPLVEDTT